MVVTSVDLSGVVKNGQLLAVLLQMAILGLLIDSIIIVVLIFSVGMRSSWAGQQVRLSLRWPLCE